jgi:SAM-dependent methyltransferase
LPDAFGLVVPVFQEADRVVEFGPRLASFAEDLPPGSELLFVDDGSTDATVERLAALRVEHPKASIRVLERPHAGKGAAITAGLRALDTPLRGFCDLDLSTPLEDLARIAVQAVRPRVLAIGSRDLTGSTLTRPEGPVREGLGRAYNRLLQATVTPGVVDTQCGAKVARAEVWDAVLAHTSEPGFAWDAEAVAVATALGLQVQEVPVTWHHDERSKVRVVRDGAAMVAATPRIWRGARQARRLASATSATEVFGDENATRLLDADRSHWWFRGKAALVATALRRTASTEGASGWLVDAGAGAGGVTAMLGWSPDRVLVLEGNPVLAHAAAARHGVHSARADVGALPLGRDSVAVVCLLDVIEHLDHPIAALRGAAAVLAPGGRLVINVPAHQWLWSEADVELGHHRRYTRAALHSELKAAGLEPVLLTHVFSWLVPPTWLVRKLVHRDRAELGLDRTSAVFDFAASVLTWIERQMLGRLALPVGTSVLCVAVRAKA